MHLETSKSIPRYIPLRIYFCMQVYIYQNINVGNSKQWKTTYMPTFHELHSASQHQASMALNCVYEHLCFISICFVYPSAGCILKYQKSLRKLMRVLILSVKFFIIKCLDCAGWNNDIVCVLKLPMSIVCTIFTQNKSWELEKLLLVLLVAKWSLLVSIQ